MFAHHEVKARMRATFYLVCAVGLTIAIFAYRDMDFFQHPDFWAEDGDKFFYVWHTEGWVSFVVPHAGYLHLVPRTAAALTSLFPMKDAVIVFNAFFLVVLGIVASVIAVNIGGIFGIMAAACIALAHGASEGVGSVTNLQWPCAAALAVVCTAPVVRRSSIPFAAIAGLSGPFVLFCAPPAIVRAWATRDSRTIALAATVVIAAIIQSTVMIGNFAAASSHSDPQPLYVIRKLISYAAGGGATGFIGLLVFFACLFVGRLRRMRVGLAFVSFMIILTTAVKFYHLPEAFSNDMAAPRYWYVPGALILISLVTVLSENSRRLKALGGVGLILILGSYLTNPFQYPPKEHFGYWSDAVTSGASEYTYPPGWKVQIPKE